MNLGEDQNNDSSVNSLELPAVSSVASTSNQDFIFKIFESALMHEEWRVAIEKEVQVFLDNKVFTFLQTRIKEATNLHTFWLFTRKLGTNIAKARLITINPKTVGIRDKDSSSPVSHQLTHFLLFNLFNLSPDKYFSTLDISAAFLYMQNATFCLWFESVT